MLSSLRLEAMREGIEDYELPSALADKDGARARALAAEAIPHVNDDVRDPVKFRQLQQQRVEAF